MGKIYMSEAEITFDDDIDEKSLADAYAFIVRREKAPLDWVHIRREGDGLNVTYGVRKDISLAAGMNLAQAEDLTRCDAMLDREEILAFKPIKDGKYRILIYKRLPAMPEAQQEIYTVANWSTARGFTGITDYFNVDDAERAF